MTSLYLISPANINEKSFPLLLEKTFRASKNIGAFQLRLKGYSYQNIIRISKILMQVCHNYKIPFYINDYYKIADELEIDGIHIGQSDGNIAQIIKHYKKQCKIGVSCMNSIDLALNAKNLGADYVSFGAFFPTISKSDTKAAELNILKAWQTEHHLPCSAIGGINLTNITEIMPYKPFYICLISAIWAQPDPALAIKKFDDILN